MALAQHVQYQIADYVIFSNPQLVMCVTMAILLIFLLKLNVFLLQILRYCVQLSHVGALHCRSKLMEYVWHVESLIVDYAQLVTHFNAIFVHLDIYWTNSQNQYVYKHRIQQYVLLDHADAHLTKCN